jgi:hypothetical protein
MPWYRAAFLALSFFMVVFVLFTFTFKGTMEMYTTDLIFWGAILRPQEVAAEDRRLLPGPVDVKDVNVLADPKMRLLLWSRGISIDKPDLFKNAPFTVDEGSFRFVGQRVDLDEPKDAPSHPENDIPQPVPVKMRLERL